MTFYLCSLLPEDPVKRAEVRFVIEYFSSKISPLFYGVLRNMTDEGKKEYVEKITGAYKRVSIGMMNVDKPMYSLFHFIVERTFT